jgi:hypothetical protein
MPYDDTQMKEAGRWRALIYSLILLKLSGVVIVSALKGSSSQ